MHMQLIGKLVSHPHSTETMLQHIANLFNLLNPYLRHLQPVGPLLRLWLWLQQRHWPLHANGVGQLPLPGLRRHPVPQRSAAGVPVVRPAGKRAGPVC